MDPKTPTLNPRPLGNEFTPDSCSSGQANRDANKLKEESLKTPESVGGHQYSVSECINSMIKLFIVEQPPLDPQHAQFDSFKNEPKINVLDWIQHIEATFHLTAYDIMASVIYLERIFEKHPQLKISENNKCRVILTATMLADKFLHDRPMSNEAWSLMSRYDLAQLNRMEIEFLKLIDFELTITPETINQFINRSVEQAHQDRINQQTLAHTNF